MISFNGLNLFISGAVTLAAFYGIKHVYKKEIKKSILALFMLAIFATTFFLSKALLHKPYQKWYIMSEIKQDPLIASIQAIHPKIYQNIVNQVNQTIANKQDYTKVIAYSYQITNQIFLMSLQSANPQEIDDYLDSTIALYLYLMQKDPNLIIRFEAADPGLTMDYRYLSDDQKFRKLWFAAINVRQNIIKNSHAQPLVAVDTSHAETLLHKIMTQLVDEYGQEAIRDAFNLDPKIEVEPELEAKVLTRFLQVIADLPQEQRILIVHYLGQLARQQLTNDH